MWALFLSPWVRPSCLAGFFCSATRFFWLSVIICLCGFTRSQHSEGSSVKNTSTIVLRFRAGCLTDQVSAPEENDNADWHRAAANTDCLLNLWIVWIMQQIWFVVWTRGQSTHEKVMADGPDRCRTVPGRVRCCFGQRGRLPIWRRSVLSRGHSVIDRLCCGNYAVCHSTAFGSSRSFGCSSVDSPGVGLGQVLLLTFLCSRGNGGPLPALDVSTQAFHRAGVLRRQRRGVLLLSGRRVLSRALQGPDCQN